MAVRLTNFAYCGRTIVQAVFIETGTYHGESLDHARCAGFEILHSIEVSERHYQAAKPRFAAFSNIHLHYGASPDILPTIIDPRRPTTFWLDAHYQGGDRAEQDPRYGECPLLAELRAIFSFQRSTQETLYTPHSTHHFDQPLTPGPSPGEPGPRRGRDLEQEESEWSPIVLIDDAHMFDDRIPPGFNRDQWPTLDEIRRQFPAHYSLVESDGILYGTPESFGAPRPPHLG